MLDLVTATLTLPYLSLTGATPISKRGEIVRRFQTGEVPIMLISLKVGGLGMPLVGLGLHERALPPSSEELADAWRPYVETCIEIFGAERCMFESNFPVDKQACGYSELWNAFKRLTADCSPTERSALFSGTAARVYRMSLAD